MTPIRIAMWSGPRNISTAMMRAFENRPDTAVVDEPYYAAYLDRTDLHHPMRDAVIAAGPTDPEQVRAALLGPVPGGRAIYYQKHMTQHMLPEFDRSWMAACENVFLIRAPEAVLASYVVKRAEVSLGDIGFVEQARLFDETTERLGKAPPVIDADDVLAEPRNVLARLCAAIGIPFAEAMLGWPPGPRATDGVWAPAWYDAVERSTKFTRPARQTAPLTPELAAIADAARPYYERLARHRLSLAGA